MAARAIWKGVVHIGTHEVPVKQQLVSSGSGEVVEYSEVRKAYPLTRGRMVVLEQEELEKLEPEDSRDITVTRFVDPREIDHRWYERAYYLGPDGNQKAYFAAAAALERKKKEGVARWVMRDKEYIGSLRAEDGYLMLIVLRHADEIIAADALKPPGGRPLQKREVEMATQLVTALHGKFDPAQYRDEYRARVMELVEAKAEGGGKPKLKVFRPRPQQDDKITDALAASLAATKKKRSASG